MKFTKYNNPNRRKRRAPKHSASYTAQMQDQLYQLLAQAAAEEEKTNLVKAYHITMNL